MEAVILVVLVVVGAPLAWLVWLTIRAGRANRDVADLRDRFYLLDREIRALRRKIDGQPPAGPPPPPQPEPEVLAPQIAAPSPPTTVPIAEPVAAAPAEPPVIEPPAPIPPGTAPAVDEEPVPPLRPPPRVAAPAARKVPAIDWELFMGMKLYAWIGGFVAFLALVFFLKLAFEKHWLSPEVQLAIEYLLGVALLAGGLQLSRRQYTAVAQTLCATAVLSFYATTFAGHAYYHLLGIAPTFALMALITAAAFVLAVSLDAMVVAVLGLLGGFLTPILLSTGRDNPLGLFSYIGLLDAGLIAVVARKRWNYLVLLAAIGTVLMQLAWADHFFVTDKVFKAMGIFLSMEVLFLVGFRFAQKRDETDPWITAGAFLMAAAPLVFTLYLLTFPSLGARPAVLFGFVLAADLGLLVLTASRAPLFVAHLPSGGAVFFILACWTAAYLTNGLLEWALGFYLVFAVLHAVFPIVLRRLRPTPLPAWWAHAFPLLALLLVLLPLGRLTEISFLVWLFVLVVDLLIIGLAIVTASLLAILGALVLTIVASALWVARVPAVLTGLPELLVVIGGFALFFFLAAVFATRKLSANTGSDSGGAPAGRGWTSPASSLTLPDLQAHLPALAAVLPFLLLIMVAARLPLANPSPVFGLALLLVVLLLGVARVTSVDALAAVGLACVLALEQIWHENHFQPDAAVVPLAWYLGFTTVFLVFPFLFRRQLAGRVIPWAVSALAGPLHFYLVYRLLKAAFPNPYMGLVPAAFAIPTLLGLIVLLRGVPPELPTRTALLAWFGGATLFFITLIFPIQFDRQWITIGWALEGTALLWLFHRVPHPGLRLVGVALLLVVFARLAVNPAVLSYHPRSTTPILNWYLYTYGIGAVCLLVGGALLAPPRQWLLGANIPPVLAVLGTVLAFLLLNIEIADYFSSGASLTFQFSGNFARDMTYSIAWALFAFILLVVGIARKLPAARYATLGLLAVTLLKLFFHDLQRLNQLYRIGALAVVAVVLLVVSFLYQRFLAREPQKP